MGEVWRARDSKLGREVAIKTLPEEFAKDEERLARFEREAKLLASLNHPNIAAIYGLEEDNGTRFLVLELVEGDTLADQLKRGAIPVEESLKLALQIAEALEAAHEKGVIHRDLKPTNIKVTPDGKIKVLDFGLAKVFRGDGSDVNLSQSPTLSMAATQQGVILGTAAYMSPEQARGEATDKRADIWAFGVVLFEMLTGQGTFDGRTVSDVLAGVLRADPDWKNLPLNLHPRIRLLLERCLEKESKDRYGDISDARVDVQKVLADPGGVLVQPATEVVQAALQSKLPWVAAFALGLALAGIAVWNLKPDAPDAPGPVGRFSQLLPEGQQFTDTSRPVVAVSPDGSRIVYVANRQLYMKAMDTLEANPIPGTSERPTAPFFSPDGQWIGFFSRVDDQLKKIAVSGGAPIMLSDAEDPFGAPSWEADDTIVFGQPEGIKRVSANGGEAELLVAGSSNLWAPQMLPDGQTLLFFDSVGNEIAVQPLTSDERTVLFPGEYARYVSTGHIVYGIENVLFAVPFDVRSLELGGGPVSLVEGLISSWHYAVSDSGVLVYVPGEGLSGGSTLVWVDRNGDVEAVGDFPAAAYNQPRLSPDGRRALLGVEQDVWIYELDRGSRFPLTRDGVSVRSVWSPDGARVAYTSARSGIDNIFIQPSDGGGTPLQLTDGEDRSHVDAWSVDGTLSFHRHGGTPNFEDVLTIPDDGGEAQVFLGGEFSQAVAVFSPDGNWVAYRSNESGQDEIYITTYPAPGGMRPVSRDGGTQPAWVGNGELFYRSLDGNTMMVAPVSTEPTLDIGVPEVVFQGRYAFGPAGPRANYDVTADGQRFLMISAGETDSDRMQINVVLNWFEELKERVPVP